MTTDANQNTNKEVAEWVRFGMRLAVSAALHPLEYSKVLIQLGYEPTAPVPGKSMFGTPIMVLPNIFQYSKPLLYMKQKKKKIKNFETKLYTLPVAYSCQYT